MARLVTTGFELNDVTGPFVGTHPDLVGFSGAAAVSSANPRSGAFHCRATTTGASAYVIAAVTQTTAVTYWCRAAFYLSTLPAGTPTNDSWALILLRTASVNIVSIELASNGAIYVNSSGATTGVVAAGNYFTLEIKHKIDTANSANGLLELLLNGSSIYTSTGATGTTIGATWRLGIASLRGSPGNGTVDVDDIAINDSSGGSQNGSTGTGKIVLLKPISDNAGGTGWTLGTGTALGGNGFAALDNIPPVGVADLAAGSDPKQVRNATSNANSNLDLNLTTYTNAGIGAGDTINVLVPFVATAAPVVTSAKQGTIGISSNPAITNIALGAAGTAGAFWGGAAGSTWPTNWKWSYGTTTYAPSVTKSSSPVARITQVTSSTRIAVVCVLGMYVDYTPVIPAKSKIVKPAPGIAVFRAALR